MVSTCSLDCKFSRLNLPESVKCKRCFRKADVVSISAREAYVWRWTQDFNPNAKPFRFGKVSAINRWRGQDDFDYCPVPDERTDQVCGPDRICHLDHKCKIFPSASSALMYVGAHRMSQAPLGSLPPCCVEHWARVRSFGAKDMKTTKEVPLLKCLRTVTISEQTPKPDDKSMELPGLEIGKTYCLERGLGAYCHPQLPFACGKGMYCKDGECVYEPIPQCAHFLDCEIKHDWKGLKCGFPYVLAAW